MKFGSFAANAVPVAALGCLVIVHAAAGQDLGAAVEPDSGLTTGSWADTVNIELPPGPRGFQPRVAIVASHSTRDGVLGSGYRLSAGSAITRHSATGGVPGHTVEDSYRLDGAPLVFLRALMPTGQRFFSPELQSGAALSHDPVSNSWTMEQNGWTWTYGRKDDFGTNATKILYYFGGRTHQDPIRRDSFSTAAGACEIPSTPPTPLCNTSSWFQSKVQDPYGNWMEFAYEIEPLPAKVDEIYWYGNARNHLLSSVIWYDATGQQLGEAAFDYAERPDPRIDLSSGTPTFRGRRLSAIRVYARDNAPYAHYRFEYKDEGGPDCDGRPLDFAQGSSDARNLLGDAPLQSLLRRIVRLDVDNTSRSRTIRCIESHHQNLDTSDWGEPEGLTEIPEPGGSFSPGNTRLAPVPLNVNGDGRSDLLLLSYKQRSGGWESDHKVLVSKGDVATPLRQDSSERGVAAWQALVDTHLTGEHLGKGRGWLIFDIDRDGFGDLLHEYADADGEPQGVRLKRYAPADDDFRSSSLELQPCDLRYSAAADVDGDGYQDLIRRAHPGDQDCAQRLQTKWLRNLGAEPWFDRGTSNGEWQDLEVPLEDPGAAGITVEPPDLNPDWTPQFFVAEQARYADFNLDGLVDVAYAFHARWEKHLNGEPCPDPPPRANEEPCQWRPVAGSAFSRIYWGDGYGDFVHSGLSAGTPILNHRHEWPGRFPEEWYTSFFSVMDLDRSGALELVTSRLTNDNEPYLAVFPDRGVAYGFGLNPVESPNADDQAYLIEQTSIPTDGYPHASSDCHHVMTLPVFADFNGDGFTDLLTLKYDPDGFPGAPCLGTDWCATLQYATRRTPQGRVTSSDGSWGGRTKLKWSFTGAPLLNGNRELSINLETLAAVGGSEGRVELDYARGSQANDGGFRGFGLVSRHNARGGLDVFAHALTPPLAGRPIYYARYRDSGVLDEVTVFVHGHLTDEQGYEIDVSAPYFNPLIRQCDYKVERRRAGSDSTLEELVRHCWGWHGRRTPSNDQLWAAFGWLRHPAEGAARDVAEAVWSGRHDSPLQPASSRVALTAAGGSNPLLAWEFAPSAGYREVGWRWPPPAVELPAALDPENVVNRLPDAAAGTGFTAEVTDWTFGSGSLQRATRIIRHRDIATDADDLLTEVTWDDSVPNQGPRMATSTTRDRGGRVLFGIEQGNFSGFDDPGETRICGTDAEGCYTLLTSWHANGTLASRERPDADARESWESSVWCGDETYRDVSGRVRNRVLDQRCRTISETWRGVVTTYSYDGFNRPVSLAIDPNGSDGATTYTYAYDDKFLYREDQQYREPRSVTRVGRRLELEYLDGFGRTTKLVSCAAIVIDPIEPGPLEPGPGGPRPLGSGSGRTGGRADVTAACMPGTELVHQWNLYGSDGLLRAFALPFREAIETPAFTVIPFRDGAGRETVIQTPAHVDLAKAAPSWETEFVWYAPGRRVRTNPLGRLNVERASTLLHETRIAGRLVNRVEMDALGHPQQSEDPENGLVGYRYDARHRLVGVERVEPAMAVDAAGVLVQQQYRRRFEYDALDRRTGVVEADGTRLRTLFDLAGRPVRQVLLTPEGETARIASWQYTEDADGVLTQTEDDETGAVTVSTFDGLGRPLSRTLPNGVVTSWSWDTEGRRLTLTNHDGALELPTVLEYDVHGRLTARTAPDGARTEVTLNGQGNPTLLKRADGATRTWSHLFSGRLGQERLNAQGGSWLLRKASYDAAGRLLTLFSDGVEKSYVHDPLDRPIGIELGGKSPLVTYDLTYDGHSRRKSSVAATAAGFSTLTLRNTYDAWGRLVARKNAGPGTRKYEYDLAGRLRFEIDEAGYRREIRYDPRGRVRYHTLSPGGGGMSLQYGLAEAYRYRHDPSKSVAHLWLTVGRDDSGAETRAWTDAMSRRIAIHRPDGSLEERVYDGSNLADLYRLGDATSGVVDTRTHFGYDLFGRLTGTYGPAAPDAFPSDAFDPAAFEGYSVTRTLGPAGRLQAMDAGGEVTRFVYDETSGLLLGESFRGLSRILDYGSPKGAVDSYPRIVAEQFLGRRGEARTHIYTRDAIGRIVREEIDDQTRKVIKLWQAFNVFGLPAVEVRESGYSSRIPTEEVRYEWQFDDNGGPLSRAVSVEGMPQGESRWTWYPNGTLRSEQGPSGKEILYDYGRPFDHRLKRIVTLDDNVVQARVDSRDPRGLATAITLPTGRVALTWDDVGRLVEREFLTPTGSRLAHWTAEYDGLGRLIRREQSDGTRSTSEIYAYDAMGRLIEETLSDGGSTDRFGYTLNAAGGRVKTQLNGVGVGSIGYDPAYPVERVVSVNGQALVHDPWDAVVQDQHGIKYGFDADGELREISAGTLSYEILRDAGGLPVTIKQGDAAPRVTHWRLNAADRPLEVLGSDGAARNYIGVEGLLLRTIETPTAGQPDATAGLDPTGSLTRLDDPRLDTATAFGDGLGDAPGDEWFVFGGMETLPGIPQVHLARHRIYDPQIGQFRRPDPVGLEGGLHRTLYANANPVAFADPLGLWACPAEPGSLPYLGGGAPRPGGGSTILDMSTSGNAQYDMMMLQLSHGLDAAPGIDLSNLSIGLDNPYLPQPCGFMCGPPGDGESGLPSDSVSPFPTAPAPTAATGGGGSSTDGAERRRVREQSKWERRLAKFELREKLKEIAAKEKGRTYRSKLADLEDKEMSELYALAGEIVGCKRGVCSTRQMEAVHGTVGLLLGDPPDDLPADKPPQARITKVTYQEPDLHLDFVSEPDMLIISGRSLPTVTVPIVKVTNVIKVVRQQPPTPPVPAPPTVGSPNYTAMLEGLPQPEDNEEGDNGLTGSITTELKGCSASSTSVGCELEISIPNPIPGLDTSITVGAEVEGEIRSAEDAKKLKPSLSIGGKVETPISKTEVKAKASDFSPCRDCNEGLDELEAEQKERELQEAKEEARRMDEEAILEAEEKCRTTNVCETPLLISPIYNPPGD